MPAWRRVLPWAVVVLAVVLALLRLGVGGGDILRYGLYVGGCVVLPGMLLLRAAWRSTGNWPEDVGLGAAAGLAYELAGWALFTALGLERWLLAWPLLALAVFAAVPALRRHWRIASPEPLPVPWTWSVAALSVLSIGLTAVWAMGQHPPPPSATSYFPDLLYHLSIVHELMRSIPPQLPQVAGESLDYHWFADAHLAAASHITGVDPAVVLFRLWLLPVWLFGLLVFAALARQVSRIWWTGPLAVAITGFPQYVALWNALAGRSNSPYAVLSPSETFGVVMTAATAVLLLDTLAGNGRRPVRARGPSARHGPVTWCAIAAMAIVAGGAKPTSLPLLVAGTGLGALFLLLRDRRPPWRWVTAGVLLAGAGVVSLFTVAGSSAGSDVRLFGSTARLFGYAGATGDRTRGMTGGWVVAALGSGDGIAVLGAWTVVASMLVAQLGLLAGFGLVLVRSTRREPAAWWLAGALLGGWLGYLLITHPSSGEAYFLSSAVPFGSAAVCWLVADGLRRLDRRRALVVAAASTGLGLALVVIPHLAARPMRGGRGATIAYLGAPMLVLAVAAGVATVAWFVLRHRRPGLRGLGAAIAVLAVLGMTLPYPAIVAGRIVVSGHYPALPRNSPVSVVDAGEVDAAVWLTAHSDPDDIVVTNTACRPARRQPPGCDARGYIVSGLAGRRTLLEGWGYTRQTLALQGVNGVPYTSQPSPWPDRAALTAQLFTRPTPELARRLAIEQHVRWVYADLRAGPVSPVLTTVGTLRYQTSSVRVLELPAR